MALGGVDTGSMKASDVQRAIATQTGMGLKPSETAVAIAIGPMRVATAVLDVSSESSSAVTAKRVMKRISDGCPPRAPVRVSPIHCDKPVLKTMPPIARPPPKSSNVPHSMPLTPSFHVNVISPFFRFVGIKKSSKPPTIAAIASGKCSL